MPSAANEEYIGRQVFSCKLTPDGFEKFLAPARTFLLEAEAKQKDNCTVKAIELIKENEGRYAYVFSYGDEDGEFFSELEHHNDWGGLPHIRISHH